VGVKIGQILSGGSGAQVDADFRHLLERLPTPRKVSATRFDDFRALGKLQRLVLTISEPSESFSGSFWRFPRPRKASATCFDDFWGLGKLRHPFWAARGLGRGPKSLL